MSECAARWSAGPARKLDHLEKHTKEGTYDDRASDAFSQEEEDGPDEGIELDSREAERLRSCRAEESLVEAEREEARGDLEANE